MRHPVVAVLLVLAWLLAGCVTPPPGDPVSPSELRILGGRDRLYNDPDSAAARWARAHPDAPGVHTIAANFAARWFTSAEPDLTEHVQAYVTAAEQEQAMPLLVASFGQCPRPDAAGLVDAFVRGIGERKAIVVLEPGLLGSQCGAARAVTGYLRTAVDDLRGDAPNALILIDATAETVRPAELARRLLAVGLADADGFTLNVGGYVPGPKVVAGTAKPIRDAVEEPTGRSDYLVLGDSSRNGSTVEGSCNPAGATVGPTTGFSKQQGAYQEAWITLPGTSDGPCGTAPDSSKGDFVPALAAALAGG
jgi:endoglucanase